MTDATPPNLQLVQDAYAAFSRGDIDGLVEAMAPDIEWYEAEHSPWHAAGGYHGPNQVVANVFARIPSDFQRFEVEPRVFHDAGDTVIVEARYLASAAATADRLDAQACHVWTIRDGKIAAFRQYTDTWQLARVTITRPA